MKNHKLLFLMPFLLISALFWSCTNLEETPYSVVTPGNFYKTEGDLIAAVMPVYASLRAYAWGEYSHVQSVSADEICVPTRGGDWDDGGDWRRLQLHTWTAADGKLNTAWTEAFGGIARANSTLDALEQSTSESELIPVFMAEVRFLRAFYYWWLLDMFGNVPIVTDAATDPDNPPDQNTRKEVYDFIVAEVTAALPDLEGDPFGAGNYGRVTKGAANALLATVYLNAEVYSGTAKWSDCVAACDAVINSGDYALMPTVEDVFALANEGPANTENIFVVCHKPEGGVSFLRHMGTLHYSQLPASPWNGFAVLADFYNSYDADDTRRDQLLEGPQLVLGGPNAGDAAFDRQEDTLSFTIEYPIFDADDYHGVRILKWPVDPNMSGGDAGNDFAIFRYSHILLAKAEAKLELGSTADALALVNQVRARAFDTDEPLTTVTLDDIFDERGYELLWENVRRQDQIRMGKWLGTWSLHETASAEYTKLYPIPQRQLDANPNLVQNTGY